jgi:hypothetical protein
MSSNESGPSLIASNADKLISVGIYRSDDPLSKEVLSAECQSAKLIQPRP